MFSPSPTIKFDNNQILESRKAPSMDAVAIHTILSSGQDAAQNFIDDNNIDSEKLVAYLRQNLNSPKKYDIRDLIRDPNSNKKLLSQFVKESVNENTLNELSFSSAGIQGLLHAVYHNWDSIKDKIKDEFYFKSFRDVLEFIKGGDQEEQRELEAAIKGMGIEILNLDDKSSWSLK
jgi:hypothetical protein